MDQRKKRNLELKNLKSDIHKLYFVSFLKNFFLLKKTYATLPVKLHVIRFTHAKRMSSHRKKSYSKNIRMGCAKLEIKFLLPLFATVHFASTSFSFSLLHT